MTLLGSDVDLEGLTNMDESWQDGPEVTSTTSLRRWLFRVPFYGSTVAPWDSGEG